MDIFPCSLCRSFFSSHAPGSDKGDQVNVLLDGVYFVLFYHLFFSSLAFQTAYLADVQRCSQVNGVHQGRAGPVLTVELVETRAGEHEGGYLSFVEADAGQVAAAGQQESSEERYRLSRTVGWGSPPLPLLRFGRRCGRRRDLRQLLPGLWSHQPETRQSDRLMAFLFKIYCIEKMEIIFRSQKVQILYFAVNHKV